MAIPIIRQAVVRETTHHVLHFDYEGERGWGFGFDCDAAGNVDESKLNPCALANYRGCLAGFANDRKMGKGYVKIYRNKWKEPKVGRCSCGAEVELSGFTNTCECGRDYNGSGQELAHRSQWSDDTGESVADILAIDAMTTDELLDGDDS